MNIPDEIQRLLAQQKRDDLDHLGRVHVQQAKDEKIAELLKKNADHPSQSREG